MGASQEPKILAVRCLYWSRSHTSGRSYLPESHSSVVEDIGRFFQFLLQVHESISESWLCRGVLWIVRSVVHNTRDGMGTHGDSVEAVVDIKMLHGRHTVVVRVSLRLSRS